VKLFRNPLISCKCSRNFKPSVTPHTTSSPLHALPQPPPPFPLKLPSHCTSSPTADIIQTTQACWPTLWVHPTTTPANPHAGHAQHLAQDHTSPDLSIPYIYYSCCALACSVHIYYHPSCWPRLGGTVIESNKLCPPFCLCGCCLKPPVTPVLFKWLMQSPLASHTCQPTSGCEKDLTFPPLDHSRDLSNSLTHISHMPNVAHTL
jgi:hypothetical protein